MQTNTSTRIVLGVVVLVLAVVEFWAILQVIHSKRLSLPGKLAWLIAIVCCNPFCAGLYYFLVHRKQTPTQSV